MELDVTGKAQQIGRSFEASNLSNTDFLDPSFVMTFLALLVNLFNLVINLIELKSM